MVDPAASRLLAGCALASRDVLLAWLRRWSEGRIARYRLLELKRLLTKPLHWLVYEVRIVLNRQYLLSKHQNIGIGITERVDITAIGRFCNCHAWGIGTWRDRKGNSSSQSRVVFPRRKADLRRHLANATLVGITL